MDKILPGRSVPLNEFFERIGINSQEKLDRLLMLKRSFMPFHVTDHFTNVIEKEKNSAYKQQLINIVLPPTNKPLFEGRFDPYGNVNVRQGGVPYLQHKYDQTLLVHFDDACIGHCQFCYKIKEIKVDSTASGFQDSGKVFHVLNYLSEYPEINNILFTGGDPAAIRSSQRLKLTLDRLLDIGHIKTLRFATKGLAYHPQRFLDKDLLNLFEKINSMEDKRINIIAQINHPAEISSESKEAIQELQKVGVQIYGQPAIVQGVNDSVETLVDLQESFLANNIQSYYLVSFMPVKGVEQYALPLEVTYQRVAESKRRLNGLAKKGMFIAAHDYGKLEVCGFFPSPESPEKIILKWHELAMSKYLHDDFKEYKAEDIMILDFKPNSLYCADQIFEYNGLNCLLS